MDYILRAGYPCSKAEVLLLDLHQPGEYTNGLLDLTQLQMSDQLMSIIDLINSRWVREKLLTAKVPTTLG